MKVDKLARMFRGWFVGNFEPTLYRTNDVEVAVKKYNAYEYDSAHYHKVATEITVLLNGRAEMNGVIYNDGDIIVIEPNDVTDFRALDDGTTTVVIKLPGANDDKYNV